jgi:phosphoglycolate phosphatase-like HAD superfamily hydrolase
VAKPARFKTKYPPLLRPFSAVPDLLHLVRDAGLRIAIAPSAKRDELDKYLDIAGITKLVDITTSSEDADESRPASDVFAIVLKKLKITGSDAVVIADTPYDAAFRSSPIPAQYSP